MNKYIYICLFIFDSYDLMVEGVLGAYRIAITVLWEFFEMGLVGIFGFVFGSIVFWVLFVLNFMLNIVVKEGSFYHGVLLLSIADMFYE